ncbi:hypothetical protein LTR66_010129 [Elasticomyces elasticus]|nr:hypothetical protein LTR66_010129 [Elasticomyces elasticus]
MATISTAAALCPSSPLLELPVETCHQLFTEASKQYYRAASFKLVFSHAFNFFRVDPMHQNLAAHPILQRIRRVELVFFCDILLLKEYPSFGLTAFCAEIKRRAQRACEVLKSARGLRHVVVSWVDTTGTGGWDEKACMLEPLEMLLNGQVQLHVGELNAEGWAVEDFTRAVLRLGTTVGRDAPLVGESD